MVKQIAFLTPPNKRIMFASSGRPTHKSLRRLLASYARRWVREQLDPRHSRALIQMNIGREVSRRLRVADEQLFRVSMGDADIDPAVVFPST